MEAKARKKTEKELKKTKKKGKNTKKKQKRKKKSNISEFYFIQFSKLSGFAPIICTNT